MTTLITFLGTGKYESVTYTWGEQSVMTNLFPVAANELFGPGGVIVFVTPAAKNHENFRTLHQKLGDKLQPVDIPEGRSEAELWEIFQRVAGAVEEGDTVLLDITHAFRSIPMVVLTVAAYLRRTKNVAIERIVYGAYEARKPFRDPPQPGDRAPVFDLTPLLDLLDWLSGAEALLGWGDARTLADRMEQTHRRLWRERAANTLPQHLQRIAGRLRRFSQALHLSRPIDAMRIAHELIPMLSEAQDEFRRWARPFAVIVEKVQAEIIPLAHEKPERLDAENMCKQLALVDYCLQKGLIVQAVTLAREGIVSWAALQKGDGDWLDRNYRERSIEEALNRASRRLRGQGDEVPEWFDKLANSQEVAMLWDWVTQLRNDLAHCGMSKQAAPIESIAQRAIELPSRLRVLRNGVPDRTLYGGRVVVDVKSLYGEVAKLDELPVYLERAKELAGEGNEVVLTGQAPVWLYLAVAHALHGKARRLVYRSPASGEVLIFDHTAR
jgi:CRISPR-associated DxTHG motif protein